VTARRVITESTFEHLQNISKIAVEAEMYARVLADVPEYIVRTFAIRGMHKADHVGVEWRVGAWRFDDYHAANDAPHMNGYDVTDPADSGQQSPAVRHAAGLETIH
jgi:hypothetical protein